MFINRNNLTASTYDRTKDFQCDDLIAPAIMLLNLKGYKTLYCCSGHPQLTLNEGSTLSALGYGDNFYVAFDKEYIFPTLPEGVTYEPGKPTLYAFWPCLRGNLKDKTQRGEYEEPFEPYQRIVDFNRTF